MRPLWAAARINVPGNHVRQWHIDLRWSPEASDENAEKRREEKSGVEESSLKGRGLKVGSDLRGSNLKASAMEQAL